MREEESPIDAMASAIADNRALEWDDAERSTLQSGDRALVEQFKIIAAIAGASASGRTSDGARAKPAVFYTAVVVLGAVKIAIGALASLAVRNALAAPIGWPAVVNIVLFGGSAVLLLAGGWQDARAISLATTFVFIAAAFADPLTRAAGNGVLGFAGGLLRDAPPEAFFAWALWRFAGAFPSQPRRRVDRLISAMFVRLAAIVGGVLFIANAALPAARGAHSSLVVWLALVDRHDPVDAFWPVLVGIALPSIPYLIWKARFEPIDEKRRVSWFVAALVVGIAPTLVIAAATPFIPALAAPEWRRTVGMLLYGSLASIIPATAYAVMVRRVIDFQWIVHKTLRYALARYGVWLASVGPLTYFLVEIYARRRQPLEAFEEGPSVGFLVLLGLGLGSLIFREQLLIRVDRWFLREPIDSAAALERLDRDLRGARGVRDVMGLLTQELDRTVHPAAVTAFVLDQGAAHLVSLSDAAMRVPASSVLVDLLRSARTTIQLERGATGPLTRLLPPADREWLAENKVELLSPLLASNAELLGILALTGSRNELPYTAAERSLVSALTVHAATRFDNQRLRQSARGGDSAQPSGLRPLDWRSEPAVCCPNCLRIWPVNTGRCPCGGLPAPAPLPIVVNDKFRLERLIGAGGMGVVYLAIDIALDRRVAVKTLPSLTAERTARLQREARAMASVVHPNLASIYGFETWRDVPLLVVEYLDGGTLAERLLDGPISVDDAIDLGIVLADVLDRIHASGILHRDIKPSNIGFTRDGRPKLLDFGLAAMLAHTIARNDELAPVDAAAGAIDEPAREVDSGRLESGITRSHHLLGTPLYLSPEAIAGRAPSPSFDVWSLTLVLYEAIAGRLPLAGLSSAEVIRRVPQTEFPDLRRYRPDCPLPVATLFAAALASASATRPQTAVDIRSQLLRLRATLKHAAR